MGDLSSESTSGPRRIRSYFRRYAAQFALGIAFLVLTQALALGIPQLLRIATDAIVGSRFDEARSTAYILVGVASVGALTRIASRLFIFNSGRRVEFDIRGDCFRHLERLSPSFFDVLPVGQVMSRMVNDLTQVRLLLGPGLLNLTNTALVYAVVIPLLVATDFELTLYSLAALPPLSIFGRQFAKALYTLGLEAQEKLGTLSSKVQENLSGVMTVRAYRREDRERRVFRSMNEDYLATNLRLARLRGFMFPMMGLFGAIGGVVVLVIGGKRMIAGAMSVGDFVQFNAYLAALTWPTIALGWTVSIWQRGLSSMERINDIFRAAPTIADGARVPPPFVGSLEIRNLSYTPPGRRDPALDGIHGNIRPGETVVVVGRTGSGKSTLLRALVRLLEISRGTIFLDGVDVVDLPLSHVRGAIAYAPQEAFLFSRTLRENIAFGSNAPSEAAISASLSAASFETDVSTFPEGLDTMVGERGITLSGGQRQRATLARALLRDAPILLLDDTLSAVDTETESHILASLASHAKRRTTIIATHRLALASRADQIWVLDDGRLVERGTEAELIAAGGLYADMHRRQRIREALEKSTSAFDGRAEASGEPAP